LPASASVSPATPNLRPPAVATGGRWAWRTHPQASGTLRDWLREPASLTARLQRCGRFRVAVLRQRLGHANADERVLLGLRANDPCLVREVALYCNEVPVIFAHTVLPASPRGILCRWLARLGSRSLGSLLFAHPAFRRSALAYRAIDRRHPLYAGAAGLCAGQPPSRLAARRCVHRFGPQRVLVSEVFLPAMETVVVKDETPRRR